MMWFTRWDERSTDPKVCARRIDAVLALGFGTARFHETVAGFRRNGRSLGDAVHSAVAQLAHEVQAA